MIDMIDTESMKKKPTPKAYRRLPEGKLFLQVKVDEDIYLRFKAKCVLAKTTMSEKVEQLIQEWSETESQTAAA